MEFQDVLRRRRMVRDYDPDRPVPPELVERILSNAVRAPSAGFSQGWGFLVLDERADIDRFWAVTTPGTGGRERWLAGMSRAPLLVVPHSNESVYLDRYAEPDKGWTDRARDRWPVPYWDIDTGFATLLMLLTVVDAGLGACFFGIPTSRVAAYRAEFGVPDSYTPIGGVTIGYPVPDRRSPSLTRGRRPVAEVTHRGRWGVG